MCSTQQFVLHPIFIAIVHEGSFTGGHTCTDVVLCTAPFVPDNARLLLVQIEVHPRLQQRELRQFCKMHDIQVVAYASLGCGELLSHSTVKSVAGEAGKTPAQVRLVSTCRGMTMIANVRHMSLQAQPYLAGAYSTRPICRFVSSHSCPDQTLKHKTESGAEEPIGLKAWQGDLCPVRHPLDYPFLIHMCILLQHSNSKHAPALNEAAKGGVALLVKTFA